jgi:hypothetical protein
MRVARLPVLVLAVVLAVPVTAWALWPFGYTSSFASRPQASAGPSSGTGELARVGPPPVAPAPPPAPAAPRRLTVHYGFDEGLVGTVRDLEGQLVLRARVAGGGALAAAPHGGGLAVRFPQPCPVYGTERCQRAILQSGPAGFLNPGKASFSYGATILLGPAETSKGANVVQKGFSVHDSQFKLQVDGHEGYPTCVVVGTKSPTIYVAQSALSVANGQWHRIVCARSNAVLTVAVDGKVTGQRALPASLSIENNNPLCIGGKGTSANNDQFAGVIDDVFVTR